MSDPDGKYDRLPGTGRGAVTIIKLWIGPDHILQVRASSFGERYKRFYFRDIQALFICTSVRALVTRSAFGILALALVALGFVVPSEAAIVAWVAAALVSIVVVVDLLRGPTCQCFVATPVQTERLRSLGRLRTARRVMDRIRPLIEQAQLQPQSGR